ncbi:MAG: six-cysteine ranthipeptide SCIFF [Oscillospiraceae bacterium]|jgi:predicted ribosomally synthesized six-cysteine peptide SCIFF|nr:six-cysteine ranthipeptide SCIFF [Oscillospiraceae bacterium]
MKHFQTIETRDLTQSLCDGGCGECQTSCQSACKTSCGVANQPCEAITHATEKDEKAEA